MTHGVRSNHRINNGEHRMEHHMAMVLIWLLLPPQPQLLRIGVEDRGGKAQQAVERAVQEEMEAERCGDKDGNSMAAERDLGEILVHGITTTDGATVATDLLGHKLGGVGMFPLIRRKLDGPAGVKKPDGSPR
jgi:hypothetical protein